LLSSPFWAQSRFFTRKKSFINFSKWVESDEDILPMKLIRQLEKKSFWRKRSFVGDNEATTAQRLYARVHQGPML
jgi:hypothetical protein